jgi:hypothetical protein
VHTMRVADSAGGVLLITLSRPSVTIFAGVEGGENKEKRRGSRARAASSLAEGEVRPVGQEQSVSILRGMRDRLGGWRDGAASVWEEGSRRRRRAQKPWVFAARARAEVRFRGVRLGN